MIKKLDIYIIRKYLGTFFFTCLLFSLIALVIDFSDKVGKFLGGEAPTDKIIFDYYFNFIPWINSLLWSLFGLISVIYFTSRMAKNTEIIPIYSSGISFYRLLRPYLLTSSLLTLGMMAANHYILPQANKERLEFERTYIWKSHDKGKYENVHLFIDEDTKVFVRFFRKRDTSITDLRLEQYDGESLQFILKAKSAKWISDPYRWQLKNYEIRRFAGMNEEYIERTGSTLDTTIAISIEDFRDYLHGETTMTTPEIRRFIQKERKRGVYLTKKHEIEIYRRTADPFSIFILTLIGFAVASRKVRGGMGLHLAIGIGIGALFGVSLQVFTDICTQSFTASFDRCLAAQSCLFSRCNRSYFEGTEVISPKTETTRIL